MVLTFDVPGTPQGKARARTVRVNGVTRSFTPENTVLYENLILTQARNAAEGQTFGSDPLAVQIIAYYAVPKSWSKKKRADALGGKIAPGKPDADNIAKVVLDALNGILYPDDKQVMFLQVVKCFGEREHVLVTVADDYSLAIEEE